MLGRGHVQQQLYTCKLTNRPPGLQPVGVSVHGIAVGNPPLAQWVEALPRSTESLPENVTIMCMDVVTSFDELQQRLEGAKALKVKASTVVAWVNYWEQLNDDLTVDDEALSQWAAMGPNRVVPVAVARTAVSPTDEGVAAALSNTFTHDRTGNAAVRQRLPAGTRSRLANKPCQQRARSGYDPHARNGAGRVTKHVQCNNTNTCQPQDHQTPAAPHH